MLGTHRILISFLLGSFAGGILGCSGTTDDTADEGTGGAASGGTGTGGAASGGTGTGGTATGGADGSGGSGADGNQACLPGGTDPADFQLCSGGADTSSGLRTAITTGSVIAYSITIAESSEHVTLLGENDACSADPVVLVDEMLGIGTYCFLINSPGNFSRLRSQRPGSAITSETFCPAGTCPAD